MTSRAESRPMAKEKAFVLDTDAAGYTGGEGVHFGDFPGVWAPGAPVALRELGFDTAEDARAAAKDLGLPLKEISVDAGSAPMPERPNHAASTPDAAAEPAPAAESASSAEPEGDA
jgi:hypothetical protein